MAAKKFVRLTGAMQASALEHAEPDRLFGGSRRGMRLVEPRLEEIDLNPGQPRRLFDREALQSLADSIRLHGQKQPIGVQMQENGRWLLVFGERRYRACRLLEQETIQAVVTDGDPLEIALIENLQRESLTAFETADAFAGLMERQGYNRSTLARVVGTTPSAVTRLMGLRALPVAVRREFETEHAHIAKSLLLELVDIGDEQAQIAAWEVVKSGVTVRELRELRHAVALPASNGAGGVQTVSAVFSGVDSPVFESGGAESAAERGAPAESPFGESDSDQTSEINRPMRTAVKPPTDRLTQTILRLRGMLTAYVDDPMRLDDGQTAELRALHDLIGRVVE